MHPGVRAAYLGQVAFSYAADLCGLNAIARKRNRSAVLALSYHGVIPDECARHPLRSRNMVSVSEFRSQMIEATRICTPISASDFRAWRRAGALLPRNPLLVTFDDGYANNLTHAVPILNEVVEAVRGAGYEFPDCVFHPRIPYCSTECGSPVEFHCVRSARAPVASTVLLSA